MSIHLRTIVEAIGVTLESGEHTVPVQIAFQKDRISIQIEATKEGILELDISLVGSKIRLVERNYTKGVMAPKVTTLYELDDIDWSGPRGPEPES